jgi:hypothetical protein
VRWLLWPADIGGTDDATWNLLDHFSKPGQCCDNVAMGDQIEFLRDLPLTCTPPRSASPVEGVLPELKPYQIVRDGRLATVTGAEFAKWLHECAERRSVRSDSASQIIGLADGAVQAFLAVIDSRNDEIERLRSQVVALQEQIAKRVSWDERARPTRLANIERREARIIELEAALVSERQRAELRQRVHEQGKSVLAEQVATLTAQLQQVTQERDAARRDRDDARLRFGDLSSERLDWADKQRALEADLAALRADLEHAKAETAIAVGMANDAALANRPTRLLQEAEARGRQAVLREIAKLPSPCVVTARHNHGTKTQFHFMRIFHCEWCQATWEELEETLYERAKSHPANGSPPARARTRNDFTLLPRAVRGEDPRFLRRAGT